MPTSEHPLPTPANADTPVAPALAADDAAVPLPKPLHPTPDPVVQFIVVRVGAYDQGVVAITTDVPLAMLAAEDASKLEPDGHHSFEIRRMTLNVVYVSEMLTNPCTTIKVYTVDVRHPNNWRKRRTPTRQWYDV